MVSEGQRGWGGRATTTVLTAGAVITIAGCGGSSPELMPAAEPAESPPVKVRPAGKVVDIGEGAEGIVFDRTSGSIALGLREGYRLAFVDPRKLSITFQVPIPNPVRHLTVSRKGIVAVPAESANTVFQISEQRGIVSEVPAGEHPHDAAYADGKLFTADEFADTVSVIERGKVVDSLPAPVQPGGIAAAGENYLALIAVSERVLQVYDARSNEPLGVTDAGVGPTHIETIGRDAFVADTEGDVIRRFRIGSEPVETDTVPAPGVPYGIAVDPQRGRVWVTLTATNRLAGYSVDGPKMKRFATYPTIRQPNSVAVEPRTGDVFVASRTEGQLERISPDAGDGG